MSSTGETKQAILDKLKEGRMTVTELSAELNLSKATVSQHLSELERLGAVQSSGDEHFKNLKYFERNPEFNASTIRPRYFGAYAKIAVVLIAALAVAGSVYTSGIRPANNAAGNSSIRHTTSANPIVPGAVGVASCPVVLFNRPAAVVSLFTYSGFKLYNVSGFQDFVIAPGNNGTISYNITSILPSSKYTSSPAPGNLTNATIKVTNILVLSHEVSETVPLNITQHYDGFTRYTNGTFIENNAGVPVPVVQTNDSKPFTFRFPKGTTLIFPNSTTVTLTQENNTFLSSWFPLGTTKILIYSSCFSSATGSMECSSGPGPRPTATTTTISVTNYTTPGINATLSVASETLKLNQSVIVTATFHVSANATLGTYLLIPPSAGAGNCGLGKFVYEYLTVGSSPYSGGQNTSVINPTHTGPLP